MSASAAEGGTQGVAHGAQGAPAARELDGRVALVTGGGTGTGEAIALALAARGARVCVTGRRAEPLEALAERVEGVQAETCDATDEDATRQLVARWRPDIVVANAGLARSAPFARTSADAFRESFEVNVLGVRNAFVAALEHMEGRTGRLIAIASTAGLKGYPYVSAYVAAKHAVVGLTRALAMELAARPTMRAITANAVCPGYTETPMLERTVQNIMETTGRDREAAEAPLKANNPQRRFVRTEEVADAVAWLAGPGAASINGQAISVSGGETA